MPNDDIGDMRPRLVRPDEVYREKKPDGSSKPFTADELAANNTAIAQWSAAMKSASYSGYKN